MKYLSKLFQPIISIPKNAKIKNTEITCKSQKLLLECGLVRPTSAGFYTLLPLARRALDKLENLVHKHMEAIDAQRISLPSLTSAGLWDKTGRLEEIGAELLRLEDRHGKKYLLAPTHEEAIADLLADVAPLSYKQLPLLLYQISNKYRDEPRCKHGLLRAREFRMLDAYAAHATDACAVSVYQRVTEALDSLFGELGLDVERVAAECGAMGGSMSHEWQLPCAAGEDQVNGRPSVEVAHTFVLGTRYSEPLGAFVTTPEGNKPVIMTCYGLGLTRLLAASVEALSTEKSLRWPAKIAPFSTIVIGPKEGSKEWLSGAWPLAETAARGFGDVVLDDRHHMTVGKRLMMADRTGYPNIVVCGKAALESPSRYELHRYGTTPQLLTLDELVQTLEGGRKEGRDDVENKALN